MKFSSKECLWVKLSESYKDFAWNFGTNHPAIGQKSASSLCCSKSDMGNLYVFNYFLWWFCFTPMHPTTDVWRKTVKPILSYLNPLRPELNSACLSIHIKVTNFLIEKLVYDFEFVCPVFNGGTIAKFSSLISGHYFSSQHDSSR